MSGAVSSAVNNLENEGFNGAAASYIVTALTDEAATSAFVAAAVAATGRGTDSQGNLAPHAALTNYAGGISRLDIPASVAAALSSVYLQAEAFQTGGPGAVLSAQTAAVSSKTAATRVASSTMDTRTSTLASTSTSTLTSGPSSQSTAPNVTSTVSSIAGSSGVLPAAATSPAPEPSSSLSSGTIAAIIVPVVVGVLLIMIGSYLFWRRRRGLPLDPFKRRPHRASSSWFCRGDNGLRDSRTEPRSFLDQPANSMVEYRGRQEPQAWL